MEHFFISTIFIMLYQLVLIILQQEFQWFNLFSSSLNFFDYSSALAVRNHSLKKLEHLMPCSDSKENRRLHGQSKFLLKGAKDQQLYLLK